MNPSNVNLIICRENENVIDIDTLKNHLENNGYSIDIIYCSNPDLATALGSMNGPGIACISGNYLKNEECIKVSSGLLMTQIKENKVLPVIIRGNYPDEDSSLGYRLTTTYLNRNTDYIDDWKFKGLDTEKLNKFLNFLQNCNPVPYSGETREFSKVLERVDKLEFIENINIDSIVDEIVLDVKNSDNPEETMRIVEEEIDKKLIKTYKDKIQELEDTLEAKASEKAAKIIKEREEQAEQDRIAEAEAARIKEEEKRRIIEDHKREEKEREIAEAEAARLKEEERKKIIEEHEREEKEKESSEDLTETSKDLNPNSDYRAKIAKKLRDIANMKPKGKRNYNSENISKSTDAEKEKKDFDNKIEPKEKKDPDGKETV